MSTLDAMRVELAALEKKLLAINGKIKPLRQAIMEADAKFKVGDQVAWRDGGRVGRGRIVAVLNESVGCHEYKIIPTLKSGNDGVAIKMLDWHYTNMTLDPEAV